MTKTLTQDVFKGAPDWVRSAAVNGNGSVTLFNVPSSKISAYNHGGLCFWVINNKFDFPEIRELYLKEVYDTTNWQQSAIDRE